MALYKALFLHRSRKGHSLKILYTAFDPVPWPKGSGTRIEATVRALAEAGAQIRLHTPTQPQPMEGFAERLDVEGINHQPVVIDEENFLDRVLKFRSSVAQLLERESFDAAIFRSPWEGLPIVGKVSKAIYEVHGFPSIELSSHYPNVRKDSLLMDRLIAEENRCLGKAKLYYTPSATSRHFLMRRGVQPSRIHLVPNTIDLDKLPQMPEAPEHVAPFRIGYMGTLAPWQGLGTLIEAIAQMRRTLPCELVIAGTRKGRWIRRIRALARSLRVRHSLEFHGPLPHKELFEVLGSCHMLAAPLPNDPRNGMQGCCPIKILEYMTCQRPIISTRIAPVEEILTHDENAILVQAGSVSAQAKAIQKLAGDAELCQRLSAAAFERVCQDYNRKDFRKRISEVYSRIVELGHI